jgi:phenylacetate-CoA ligase
MLQRFMASWLEPGRTRLTKSLERDPSGWDRGRSADEAARVWREAYARVPYYRALAAAHGGDLPFEQAPVLTKAVLRAQFDALVADGISREATFRRSTGGATGQPVTVLYDISMRDWSLAAHDYCHRAFLGIEPFGGRIVMLWGSDLEAAERPRGLRRRLMQWATGTVCLNTYRMTDEQLARQVEVINRVRPDLVYGYAGSIFNVARFALSRGVRLHRPRAISATAEMLQRGWREAIREAFGTPVSSYYASREVGPVAMECREGRHHLLVFHNYVEVAALDSPSEGVPVFAPAGTEGRLLVTTLRNRAMPLVRYEIGDLGALAPPGERCGCGSPLPVLASLAGRLGDYLRALDGSRIKGGYFHAGFVERPWLREYQITQTAADCVELYCVQTAPRPDAEAAAIEAHIRRALGAGMRIVWHEVSDLPRTPHGKRMFTRCLIGD